MCRDVSARSQMLEFGTCQTGQCKVFTVQLHNYKQVPAEFSIKKPAEVIKAKDWQFFACEPLEGTVEPEQKLNLKVRPPRALLRTTFRSMASGSCPAQLTMMSTRTSERGKSPELGWPVPLTASRPPSSPQIVFTPVLNRDAPYSQSIPMRINLNPRGKELTATGRGLTPRVSFSPTFVDCGPILPFFEGQAPNEAKVVMSNPCAFPIEVRAMSQEVESLRGL